MYVIIIYHKCILIKNKGRKEHIIITSLYTLTPWRKKSKLNLEQGEEWK